jgi:hypothetical protein
MTEIPHRHPLEAADCYEYECRRLTTKEWGALGVAGVGFLALAALASALLG